MLWLLWIIIIFVQFVVGYKFEECVNNDPMLVTSHLDIFQLSISRRLNGKCKNIIGFNVMFRGPRVEMQFFPGKFQHYEKPVSLDLLIGSCGHRFYVSNI